MGDMDILEMQTRFLMPFLFEPASSGKVGELLGSVNRPVGEGALWESVGPVPLFTEEFLPHVSRYLFGEGRAGACQVFRLHEATSNGWFGRLQMIDPSPARKTALDVTAVSSSRAELYVAPSGAGLLSVALQAGAAPISAAQGFRMNYRLSQIRMRKAGRLRVPHPKDDDARWAAIPEEQRTQIPERPSEDAALMQRLGRSGGTFALLEVVDELLRPLAEEADLEPAQEGMGIYTVVRLGADSDLADPGVRRSLVPLVSGLAQVEEETHAGAVHDDPGIPHAVLNRRHLVAAGHLGVAHVVSDQPDEHSFNPFRVQRVFTKYFVPFVLAELQRLSLTRIASAAGRAAAAEEDTGRGIQDVRSDLLDCAAASHFTQISSRDVIQRYYRLCQAGLGIHDSMGELRRVINDIDDRHHDRLQTETLAATARTLEETRLLHASMDRHLHVVAHIQIMVEFLEIFLVSVYAAHLVEMLLPVFHVEEQHIWVGLGALAGLVVTTALLRPWRHFHKTGSGVGSDMS